MDVATLAYFYIYKAVPSYDDQVATEHADGAHAPQNGD